MPSVLQKTVQRNWCHLTVKLPADCNSALASISVQLKSMSIFMTSAYNDCFQEKKQNKWLNSEEQLNKNENEHKLE